MDGDNPFDNLKKELDILRREREKQRDIQVASLIAVYGDTVVGILKNVQDTFHSKSSFEIFPVIVQDSYRYIEWGLGYCSYGDRMPISHKNKVVLVRLNLDENCKALGFDCHYSSNDYKGIYESVSSGLLKQELIDSLKDLFRKAYSK